MSIIEALKRIFKGEEAPKKAKTQADPECAEQSNWSSYLDTQLGRNVEDRSKYTDYELMDAEIPEISTALDVIADFVVYPDNVNKSKVFKVKSKNKENQKIIDEIETRTKFQTEFHSIVRDVCKYGDDFEEILFGEKTKRVVGFKSIPVETVIVKMENGIKNVSPMIQQINSDRKVVASLNDKECLHFSLKTDRRRYGITGKGVSRIEKARLIYRQVRLMEEGLIISRLSRSNQNYAIIVDVGDLDGDDALDYLRKYQQKIIRRKYIDPATGQMSYKYNPLSQMEDIYVPTRQGSGGNVVALNKGEGTGKNIEDVNYFQNKMIYAVGVPKLLIGKEEDINSKSTSDMQFICFLRMIRMIQTVLEAEIIRFFKNALEAEKIQDDTLYVDWPVCGTIDEERKWKIEQIKCQVAAMMSQDMSIIDDQFIYSNILGWDDALIAEVKERMEAAEDAAEEEFNAQLALARDDTGNPEAEDEYMSMDDEDPDVQASKTNPNKPKKPTKPTEDDEEESITKEKYMEMAKARMTKKQYTQFEKMSKLVEQNKELRSLLYQFIHLTNTRIGEF